ncbi:MAG: hypothetical protein Q9164_004090 [Protoblastenia rupestris]
MRNEITGDGWDFFPVIDLIHSLSPNGEDARKHATAGPEQSSYPPTNGHILSKAQKSIRDSSLGNFDEVWKYLGRSAHGDSCPNASPLDEQISIKAVRWRDQIDGADLADLADNDEIEGSNHLAGLTKQQRKKARRTARRNALADTPTNGRHVPSSSETESEEDVRASKTLDRKIIIHNLLDRPLPDESARNGLCDLKRTTPEIIGKWPVAKSHAVNGLHKSPEKSSLAVAAARKAKLLNMLKERFIDESQYLNDLSLVHHTPNSDSNTLEGIHVFIDASNIMIGYHDALKLSRSLPLSTRMRRQPISFHSLSLILSRGRPCAKRIIVGSDNFPEMAEAKLIGYETNILDRVHKAKELTPRQRKYASTNINGSGSGNGTQSAGSGSETTTAVQYAREKWVEQAVDEILHLKMMESIVDAAEPSTMILATGDAAEAEYSGGFLKMVERALQKGWRVELVSFRHNTSGGWRKREWRQRWGDRFRIVELDDFVEVLLRVD